MEKEIDHEYTDDIVCPHCGHTYQDSFEFSESGEEKCDECKKPFSFERNISCSYSTEKITEKSL